MSSTLSTRIIKSKNNVDLSTKMYKNAILVCTMLPSVIGDIVEGYIAISYKIKHRQTYKTLKLFRLSCNEEALQFLDLFLRTYMSSFDVILYIKYYDHNRMVAYT